jgi:2-methylcitrate dehydratase PrpD
VTGSGGERAFSEAARQDPAIAALRRRVTMKPYEPIGAPPKDRPARVTWHLAGGERLSAVCESAEGGADRPIPPDMLRRKFTENAGTAFPAMLPIFDRLIAGDRDLLGLPWRTLVDGMVGRGRA